MPGPRIPRGGGCNPCSRLPALPASIERQLRLGAAFVFFLAGTVLLVAGVELGFRNPHPPVVILQRTFLD